MNLKSLVNITTKNKFAMILAVLLVSGSLIFTGCGDDTEADGNGEEQGEQEEQNEDNKSEEAEATGAEEVDETVEIAYVNWADCVATTKLAQVILEDEMGYDVELTMADPGPIYTEIADGEHDAFLGSWLPITHEEYWDEYEDEVDQIPANFEGARIGLVVPEFVDIDSITELNDVVDQFDGEIIGIDPGAGIMQSTETAIPEYDLDYELIEGSDPAMAAALQEGIEDEDWVVVTGWIPHWKFAEWDLKFLEDPEKVYGEEENIYSIGRDDLEDDLPEVREFLENYQLTEDGLGNLMGVIEEQDDELEAAREWAEENSDLIDEWVPAQ